MICYRDKRWCPFWMLCHKGLECPDAFTSLVKARADTWWESFKSSDPAPIDLHIDKPECYKEMK